MCVRTRKFFTPIRYPSSPYHPLFTAFQIQSDFAFLAPALARLFFLEKSRSRGGVFVYVHRRRSSFDGATRLSPQDIARLSRAGVATFFEVPGNEEGKTHVSYLIILEGGREIRLGISTFTVSSL